MNPFEKDLRKAAEMYVNRDFDSDIPSGIREETDDKIKKMLKEDSMKPEKKRSVNRSVKAVILCAAVLALSVVVCAAAPAIREYINMTFLKEDSSARLTEVPDGYIGIYTAEDLDNVREDLFANYILMNDIVITEEDYAVGGVFEGGFEPIGSERTPYHGTFNGNGYVIDGLVINVSEMLDDNWSYQNVGLFGKVQRASCDGIVYETVEESVNEAEMEMDINGDGDLDDSWTSTGVKPTGEVVDGYMRGGIIKNLGLVNGSVTAEKNISADYRVGAIAGCVDFIAGCYTENFSVTFVNNTSDVDSSIGGIAGKAEYADSCWTDAVITVEMNLPEGEEFESTYVGNPYIAGVIGEAYACVTSYFDGKIHADEIEYNQYEYPDGQVDKELECITSTLTTDGIANIPEGAVPAIMTEAVMQKLIDSLDDWSGQKMLSFYMQSDYYTELEIAASQYTTDNTNTVFYLLDPECKPREIRELSRLILEGFKDVSFEDFCRENSVKYGTYYCYDLRGLTECSFGGFDFDNIWTRSGYSNPTLRLFSGGSEEVDQPNGFRDRVSVGKNIFSGNN